MRPPAEKFNAAAYVVEDPIFFAHRMTLLELASSARIPTIHELRRFPEAGALMSYGPDLHDLFRRAAFYVDRILKGETPADLPVQQPTKFELVINLKTAQALGLEIPPTLLALADRYLVLRAGIVSHRHMLNASSSHFDPQETSAALANE